ncbi:MAG: 4Fe-4S dicluster domain-containing protein [Phycisphaerae bacterium]|jgi:Na+-transporting NADH:ubiquinone oxidoreductase subunit A|nr:4Fe-4S dicluster domain-containing protein [Phycisphaerae bacterium]
MKPRGGYNVNLIGGPATTVEKLAPPEKLCIPLHSKNLNFTELRVSDGDSVTSGQTLAVDPEAFSVPLLASCGGTVKLSQLDGHIVIENLSCPPDPTDDPDVPAHVSYDPSQVAEKCRKLLDLGAWQFVSNARTQRVADPQGTPSAVIVSTVHLEPFVARGSAICADNVNELVRGLEHLQSLLEYQAIHLVLPNVELELAQNIQEIIRGHAWLKLSEVPLQMRYPFDNQTLLARHLGLFVEGDETVWYLPVEGVIAFDGALTYGRPCTNRIISLAGPAVKEPTHLEVRVGYPIDKLLAGRLEPADNVRVVNGGILTGREITEDQAGIDVECSGLTALEEPTVREMFGWLRPGGDRRSYSKCFTSSLKGEFAERLSTSLRGEGRPCVACGQCVSVCPAGIMPNAIHKYLFSDELEQAQRMRTDLCVECGLCSYICPSKLDLYDELVRAKVRIDEELGPPPGQQEEQEEQATDESQQEDEA